MEQADEKILRQRAAAEEFKKQRFSEETIEEENRQSIFDGTISINKIPVTFAERLLFDSSVGIWLPTDFAEWPKKEIEKYYVLGSKPDFVLGNGYLDFSVGFHHTSNEVPNEMMGEFADLARMLIEQAGPQAKIYGKKVRKRGKHIISSLELVTHAVGCATYNVLFFSSLQDRVMIGFINFDFRNLKRYKPIVKEIAESFRYIDDEAEKNVENSTEEENKDGNNYI